MPAIRLEVVKKSKGMGKLFIAVVDSVVNSISCVLLLVLGRTLTLKSEYDERECVGRGEKKV